MTKNKSIFTFLGFVLFLSGMSALVLSLVGVQLSFLTWIDSPGKTIGFLIRLAMILTGIIMIFLSRSNFDGNDKEWY